MPVYQSYNSKNNAWVKYKFTSGGIKILDVKQREPMKPFKKTKIKGKRR